MREQDHAAGFPSIALPYETDDPSGKRGDAPGTLAVLAHRQFPVPQAAVLAGLGAGAARYEVACRAAARNGTDVASELIAAGAVDESALADAVAAALRLRRRRMDRFPSAVAPVGRGRSRRILRTVEPTPRILIAPRVEDLGAIADFLAAHPTLRDDIEVASRSDLDAMRAELGREARVEAARLSLSSERLDLSARLTVTGAQGFAGALAIVGLVALLLMPWGSVAVHAATLALYLGCISLRFRAMVDLLRPRDKARESAAPTADAAPHPSYSVLVALRNENADTVETLVAALAALRWPRSKLQILLICEEDDRRTVEVVRHAIRGRPSFRLEEVPACEPRTKPKALNFALPLATGEFVVLYDAEDRPAPDQLLAAWQAFRAGDPTLACVQAPLVVTNAAKGWLATHFAIEYAALFLGLLPWLAARGMPLPLGGTSNHFRRDALLAVGGWDSHNVTEDADLGVRLARSGHRTGVIGSPTFEEAPERWLDWRNQRTRWMKGYAQTWLTHMRDPARLRRELGSRDFGVFQLLFAGMLLSSALNTCVLGFLVYNVCRLLAGGWPGTVEGTLLMLDAVVLLAGFGVYATLAYGCCRRAGLNRVIRDLWTLPAYWLLVSIATLRALMQLRRAPHFWEKTPHGAAARRDGGETGSEASILVVGAATALAP